MLFKVLARKLIHLSTSFPYYNMSFPKINHYFLKIIFSKLTLHITQIIIKQKGLSTFIQAYQYL